jgi:ADP-ribosylglycohydrolase
MKNIIYVLMLVLAVGCGKSRESNFPSPSESAQPKESSEIALSREEYYDKVLGMLVGSAIGDAMGAPTEMWARKSIEIQKGYVDSLDFVVREWSPEGPWATNMPAGATTDDTRWKYLGVQYLLTQKQDSLNPFDFAKYIIDTYDKERVSMGNDENDYESIEKKFSHMTWLIEWVKVAQPFVKKDLIEYNTKLSRFYGGEMSCAGMLYTPVMGAYYPGMPVRAYQQAYGLSIFDIGYARDISSLTAAYVAKAMEPGVAYNDITLITRELDPQKYFNSRLIGRMAYKAFEEAKNITSESRMLTEKDIPADLRVPVNFKHGALYYVQQQKAYSLLETKLQDIPFHAGEIHLINLTALEFSGGDFMKAMEFVTNFGRDNDTVGAVTGAILGAYWGAGKLPQDMVSKALKTNKETVGIDLEMLAQKLVDHRMD